jgi:NADPH:quinone reductase-like Zn-dependent oxidoreductase
VKALGADLVIDHSAERSTQTRRYRTRDPRCQPDPDRSSPGSTGRGIAPQGKLALIDDPKTLDVTKLKRKSLSLHWEFMYTRSLFETADMIEQHNLLNRVARLIDAGTLKTTVGEHFGTINATNLRRAHALLESGKSKGKIVLEGF